MTRKIQLMRITLYILSVTASLMALETSGACQATDLDNPTKLTVNAVAGRLARKGEAHYYSFVGGPGEVKLLLDGAATGIAANIYGQLSDVDGRTLTNVEKGLDYTYVTAEKDFRRAVARYEIKRRQILVVKVWSDDPALYKIRLDGEVSFDQGGATGGNAPARGNLNNDPSCIPKSGILRLVMADDTVQEINLSRVKEISIKP